MMSSALRAAHSESSEMSGTIEIVVVTARISSDTPRRGLPRRSRGPMLNPPQATYTGDHQAVEKSIEEEFVLATAKRTGKAAPKGRADQDTNWRRNTSYPGPIERRSRHSSELAAHGPMLPLGVRRHPRPTTEGVEGHHKYC